MATIPFRKKAIETFGWILFLGLEMFLKGKNAMPPLTSLFLLV